MKPRLLDLYCGAGGAAVGYARAGFDVIGVDVKPQPNYPFDFRLADAIEYATVAGPLFDVIHASPPCPRYSAATRDPGRHPDLYVPTRELLEAIDVPWVIENVIGAPYRSGIILCGSQFSELRADGEWVRRHRNFESNVRLWAMPDVHPSDRRPITITGHTSLSAVTEYGHSRQGTRELASRLLGIDWMSWSEMTDAIPPAYTEYVGRQLMEAIR